MDRAEIVTKALEIAEEYKADGLTLTLRQLYYRFVALGFFESSQKVYKRIGATLTEARYDGRFPIEYLEDRGRSVAEGDCLRNDGSLHAALRQASNWLRQLPEMMLERARWYNQTTHISVWVEKEALAGIFEPVCRELGVSWFACKGYPSVSSLAEWLEQVNQACGEDNDAWLNYRYGPLPFTQFNEGTATRAVILYFGDHDPDGWEIPRSAERNIKKLRALEEGENCYGVEFKRVALNMNQIQQFNPPPFEAKFTSARYKGYIDEHQTNDAWELDALEPRVLRELIRDHVDAYWAESVYLDNERHIGELRNQMRERMREPTWAAEALE